MKLASARSGANAGDCQAATEKPKGLEQETKKKAETKRRTS